MFKTSLFFVLVGAAMAQTAAPVSQSNVMAGRATLTSGAVFAFRSVLRPASHAPTGLGVGGIFTDLNGNTVHRYMIDESNGSYFGYDVVIGTPDATGAYLVTFQPLSHMERIDGAADLRLVVLPKYPPPQMMHDGESIELDLMVSPDGSRKLTDIISIRMHEPPIPAAKTTTAPRDFTVDDGPITFDASRFTVWRQGKQYPDSPGFTGKPGATLWVALPGQGRYILSLIPHEGFTRSGNIRDNVVSFEDAGQRYEVRFQSPVAGAGKAWNLYVMHDATYKPDERHADSVNMGTDRLDNLVAKH
jgi:hypothetical protein